MLTQLTPHRSLTASSIKSLPSRALANYARASQQEVSGPTDSVSLSEQAKAKPQSTSGLRKIGTFVALGLSFVGILGAAGCSGAGSAPPPSQPDTESVQDTVTVQTQDVDLSKAETKETSRAPQLHQNLKGKSAEEIAETVGQESRKVGQKVVEELKTEGQKIKETFQDKNAEEIAETIGQEGRRLGKQIGEEGKKVGQEAAKVGKEVGKVAKGFWRGITGKNKK